MPASIAEGSPRHFRARVWLACVGAFGAVSPDILLLYSKRWTKPSMTFSLVQYAVATLLYVGLAGVIAAIYPYGTKPTPWKAFAVGVGVPLILSALAAARSAPIIAPRGVTIPGDLYDLLSLF